MADDFLRLQQALHDQMADKRVDILRRVAACGSISEAARQSGVSYKAAWQAIDTLSNLAGTALVTRAVGGAGGGGAVLTPAGERLLGAASVLHRLRADVLQHLVDARGDAVQAEGLVTALLSVRTSMRNQLLCNVVRKRTAGNLVQITLDLDRKLGLPITSAITRESAQLLGIVPGRRMLALFKATAVEIVPAQDAPPLKNRLPGHIGRIGRTARGGEAMLQLANDTRVVGFVAPGHGLRLHQEAVAVFEPNAVVLAAID